MPHETLRGRNPKSESHKKPPTTSSFSLDETRGWLQASAFCCMQSKKNRGVSKKIWFLALFSDWEIGLIGAPHILDRDVYTAIFLPFVDPCLLVFQFPSQMSHWRRIFLLYTHQSCYSPLWKGLVSLRTKFAAKTAHLLCKTTKFSQWRDTTHLHKGM